MKKPILCLSFLLLSACGLMPQASPPLTQHDLGGGFRTLARPALPLRTVTVSSTPVVAGLSMHYRNATDPTTRGVYAFNRWAAPPATLVDQALTRLLPVEPTGRCRLSFLLSDFILEIDAQGKGSALLAGTLRLSLDGKTAVFKRIVDVRVPVPKVEPSAQAQGLRDAVIALADQTSAWITGDIEQFCKQQ